MLDDSKFSFQGLYVWDALYQERAILTTMDIWRVGTFHDPHLPLPELAEVSHITYLQTKRGTKLLTSGWWGMVRKINYSGDWLMGLSWCMVCGFESIVPYYYAIYFAILPIHRSIRDDRMCKYKAI